MLSICVIGEIRWQLSEERIFTFSIIEIEFLLIIFVINACTYIFYILENFSEIKSPIAW